MNEKKYFVVSLPRSGTTSICKMAKICGLNPRHAPHTSFKRQIVSNEFNFFSDTPVFCPDEIERICSDQKIDSNFIYIDRNFDDIFKSWENVKLYRNYLGMLNSEVMLKPSQKFDFDSYNNAFGNEALNEKNYNEIFQRHKENVLSILNKHGKHVLIYKFEEGWSPFCSFLNVDIPQEDVPVMNKNKMFDKI